MASETFSISYGILFSVKVLHRYFLNYAEKAFDAGGLSADDKKAMQLIARSYEVGKFWQVIPGEETRQLLRDQQMIFRSRPDGFCLAVATDADKPAVELPAELELNFCIYPTDNFFLLYTDLAKAVMDDLLKNDKVFVLTNSATLPDISANMLNTNETIEAANLIKRTDAPASEFPGRKPIGLIRIRHQPTSGINLLAANGKIQTALSYNLLLRNRRTHWKYQENDLGQKPLVQQGLIPVTVGAKKLPNPTPATTIYQNNKFLSVIY